MLWHPLFTFTSGDAIIPPPVVEQAQRYGGKKLRGKALEENLREIVEGQWELLELKKRNQREREEREAQPAIEVPQPAVVERAIAPPPAAPQPKLTRLALPARAPVAARDPGDLTDAEIIDLVMLLDAIDEDD